tara:strand:- start:427946 stop:429769 length:1824 start_codon:yes stop_codon:yes gene_type:complete
MKTENLIQGSPEWDDFRLKHYGASEAAAMLGISTKVKRTELLHIKHTGNAKEFSDWVRANILDYGHEVEAMARPLVEAMISEDLYPVTGSEGILSASCDGLTIGEDIAFEHKQWNEALAAAVRAGQLPEEYMPQCQQVLMVTGAEKLIFVCSNGTSEKFESMEIFPDESWFKRIVSGWEQFTKDLAEYKPKLLAEKPEADAIKSLPALAIQIRGEVINSNLPAFKAAADAFIEQINVDLKTDEDFSNAEATVKYCAGVEENLALAKKNIIAQTATIEDVMLTIDQVSEQIRSKRLMLDKLVKSKKEEIRESILSGAKLAYSEHVAALELEIKPIRLVYTAPDFAGAMKNKRTLASLHDAVDTLLANAKIATNEMATDLRAKLTWIKGSHPEYGFLFMDLQTIIHKQTDDFQLLVNSRVTEHKAAEKAKEEAAREKIRLEEVNRLASLQEEEDALIASIWKNARRIEFDSAPYIQKAINTFESGAKDFDGDTRKRVVAAIAEARAEMSLKLEEASKDEQQRQEESVAIEAEKPAVATEAPATNRGAAPLTESKHSPVPEKKSSVAQTTDSQIIDVVMDVFGLSESDAIDRLERINFAAARKNLVATAA